MQELGGGEAVVELDETEVLRADARPLVGTVRGAARDRVEILLNWLEFGDPARDEAFVRATNKAMRAGVRAWTELSGGR